MLSTRNSLRQESAFYSVLQFTSKLGGAVGPLYGGFALHLIDLEEGVRPAKLNRRNLMHWSGLVPPG